MNRSFHTTRWSLVLAAADSRDGRAALQALCEAYWMPLYGYVRRRGYSVHESQDLTQSFFASLLERTGLAAVPLLPAHGPSQFPAQRMGSSDNRETRWGQTRPLTRFYNR
jgi:hypothetical protein